MFPLWCIWPHSVYLHSTSKTVSFAIACGTVSTSAELGLPAYVDDVCWYNEYVFMGSGACNEDVHNTLWHLKEIKACVSGLPSSFE